jgi:subtilisin family serine protease
MRLIVLFLCFTLVVQAQNTTFSFDKIRIGIDCQPDILLLKVKNHSAVSKIKTDLVQKFSTASFQIEQLFPKPKNAREGKNALGQSYVDISKIYQVHITGNFDLLAVRRWLSKSNQLEYIEPKYIHQINYTPNDPQIALQWQIGKIQAEQAWSVSQGDSAFVVGIIDTGTDPNHPDLNGNVKHNTSELIDGIDNDGDGYIDNRLGWDFVEDDNNPDAVQSSWGTWCFSSRLCCGYNR